MLSPAVIALAVALLGCATILVFSGVRDWRLWRALRRLDPTAPDELVRLARTGKLRNELVVVVGVAQPGPDGLLSSTVNAAPCVWHRHTIHRRRVRRLSDGRTRNSPFRRRIANHSSNEPIMLTGASATSPATGTVGAGRIELRLDGLHVDRPTRAGTRVLPGVVSQPMPDAAGLMAGDRYTHREWIVRAGSRLVVLAQATLTGSGLVVRRPPSGPHIVSTRSARGLRLYEVTISVVAFVLALVAVVAAIMLLVGARL